MAAPDKIASLPLRPCVGLMLVNADGLVFVGQRIDNPGPAWQMPQGGIDEGETPEQAALRELGEETGLAADKVRIEAVSNSWHDYDLPAGLARKLWSGRYRGQTQKWFLLRFLGVDEDVDIETAHPEFSRWRWIRPDELDGCVVPFKRETYAKVLEEFRGLL